MRLCPGYLEEGRTERKKTKTTDRKHSRKEIKRNKEQEKKQEKGKKKARKRHYITITVPDTAKVGRTREQQHNVAEAGVDSRRDEVRW